MQKSTLIAGLVVGIFVLALATFFGSVLVMLNGPLAVTSTGLMGLAYSVLGICGAGALVFFIAADAIVERRVRDPVHAATATRALRAVCAWTVGMLGAGLFALLGEWTMLVATGIALGLMALQFPRRGHIS